MALNTNTKVGLTPQYKRYELFVTELKFTSYLSIRRTINELMAVLVE